MPRQIPILLALLAGVALGVTLGLLLDGREGSRPLTGEGLVPRADAEGTDAASRGASTLDQPRAGGGARRAGTLGSELLDPSTVDSVTLARAESLAQEALAEVSAAPAAETPSGEQAISGTVIDHLGQPVPGATVHSSGPSGAKEIYTWKSQSRGRDWPGPTDLSASLRDKATSSLVSRARSREVVTDEEGRFRVSGLAAGTFRVQAYAEGQVFSYQVVAAGGSTLIVGKKVQLFEFLVEREDGTPVESAVIELGQPNSPQRYEWTSGGPALRHTQSADWFRVLSGHVVDPRRGAIFADLTSERRWVDLSSHGEGPHRFVLKPSRSLEVTVVDQEVDSPRPTPTLAYALSDRLRKKGGRSAFSSIGKKVSRDGDGAFRVMDLDPGDYVLGVGRDGGSPVVFREFTMGAGNVRETVELPRVDRSRYHVVNVRSFDGAALPGAKFIHWSWANGKHVTKGLSSTERRPGEYWVPRLGPAASASLVTTVPGWGSVIQPFATDASELTATLRRPCLLTVQVTGPTDLTFEVMVSSVASVANGDQKPLRSGKKAFTDGKGQALFHGLQPGRAQISVKAGRSRSDPDGSKEIVATELVSIHSGEQRVNVAPEALFEVEVHAPAEERGRSLELTALGPPGTPRYKLARHHAYVDSSGRVTFKNVKAGSFELAPGGTVPSVIVTVPSGVIRYERPQLLGYGLRIQKPGAVTAPFLPEDIVIAVDGNSATIGQFSDRLSLAFADAPAEITVLRDGREQTVELKEWLLDVSFIPVARPLD